MIKRSRFIATAVWLLGASSGLFAQDRLDWNPAQLHATRQELQELLSRYEESARSRAYSAKLRERAQFEATLIRQRLDQGDFQVGDKISLVVEGEPTLSDTMRVTSAITILLPSGETISLKNVLRSELESKLLEAVGKIVKQPRIRAESYLRLGILGAVGTQGFYELSSDALLTDVLMRVGFPAAANLEEMKIERDKKTIWEGEPLREALTEGRTLDQLSLRAGDLITVPAQGGKGTPGGGFLSSTRGVLMIFPAIFAAVRVWKWF